MRSRGPAATEPRRPLAARLSPERLRLIVITDPGLATPKTVEAVAEQALEAGAPSIQLRDKHQAVGELLPLARRLRDLTRRFDALFFVNDRLDLAWAVGADGVHLGPTDLPVSAVRSVVPDDFLIGFSADDPDAAKAAVAEGADYLGCGTVWPTGSKRDAGQVIGIDRLRRVVAAVEAPVVAIGGITPERASLLPPTGTAGAAVIGAVMSAQNPAEAVSILLALLDSERTHNDP